MSLKLRADDAALAAAFLALRSFNSVATLLEISPRTLGFYLHKKNNYKLFHLKKRCGGERLIAAPVTPLKILQRKLNQVLQAVYRGRSPAHGCIRNRSIITNASRHLGKRLILNFDLSDFFPSIHFGRVKGLFEGKPYYLPKGAALTLAQICCYKGVLPAGAPTSPTVANMLCAQLDSQLKNLAKDAGCIYTRYVDDITISTSFGRFSPAIFHRDPITKKWVIGEGVLQVVKANHFKIHPTKTRFLPRNYRQEVTGLIASGTSNGRLNVKRMYVRHVRAILHAWERWGLEKAAAHFHAKHDRKQRLQAKPDFARVVRGKIEFIGSVRGRDDELYLSLLRRFLRLNQGLRARPVLVTSRASDKVLMQAIWLLQQQDGPLQGTAFAAEGLGLITAFHVRADDTVASRPALDGTRLPVVLRKGDEHVDVARLDVPGETLVQLKLAPGANPIVGDKIRILGFPLYRVGASVQIDEGKITGSSPWHGVPQFTVSCSIVKGNSGGPVLDSQNRVIGIAVKGQGIPKKFTEDDELSRFVPIAFALPYLS